MGNVEQGAKQKRRKGEIQTAVLSAIGLAGILLVSMAAPNTLQLLGKFTGNKYRFNNQAKNALSRLAAKKYVTFVERGGKRFARITDAGKRALLLEQMKFSGGTRKRWDQRWRVVMFDVPERRRATRDSLRRTMQAMGFFRLQDSAWVYPYDCEDVVALVKAELEIGKDVMYLVVEHMGNDRYIRNQFGLK